MTSTPATFDFDELRFDGSPTAFLFEGRKRAGIGISMFIVRTAPGGSVGLHTHPYSETFVLLEGEGRWTAGDAVIDDYEWLANSGDPDTISFLEAENCPRGMRPMSHGRNTTTIGQGCWSRH